MSLDNLLVTHGTRNAVDVWILNTEEEIKKRTKKRLKKLKREREEKKEEESEIDESVVLQDRIRNNHMNPLTVQSVGKLRGLDAVKTAPGQYRMVSVRVSAKVHYNQV